MRTLPHNPHHAHGLLRRGVIVTAVTIAAISAYGMVRLPDLGAGGLLYPTRHVVARNAPDACVEVSVTSRDGLRLRGWRCNAAGVARGTVVYLHGVADNRGSAAEAIRRFTARGFEVVAFDARAHGASDGEFCTYGYHERHDVQRIVATLREGPIVLIGTSMGASVAVQAAAIEPRVSAVVAAEAFSDLATVARERAPFVFTEGRIQQAFRIAEQRARFVVADVSPQRAAARIRVPVLLLHGEQDRDTSPDHSRRVFAALGGPGRLILVPGVGHNGALNADTWPTIEQWIDGVIAPR